MSRYPANIITKSPATPTGPNPITGRAPGVWRMEDVAYWLKQGVWPDASADGYWPYTSLLLSSTSLSNANNNLFVDSSGAFNPVSRNGNTTQGSFTPYGSYWSNYFDGSGDYLDAGSNAAFAFGTGAYTVECWLYINSASGVQNLFCNNTTNGFDLYLNYSNSTTRLELRGGSNIIAFSYVPPANQWVHLALVRSGTGASQTVLYANGVSQGSGTDATNWTVTGSMVIGGLPADTVWLNGYMSNARLVKGTAVYTANFTPPAAPLTAISGTSLLTCQSNRFIDNSSNAFAITVNGDTKVQKFSPFTLAAPGVSYNQSDITNWSGYFDGSGGYLTAPSNSAFEIGTGQFTLECWIYFNTVTNINEFLWADNSGTTGGRLVMYYSGGGLQIVAAGGAGATTASWTPVAGQWYHLAASRDASNNQRLFVNGVLLATATSTNNYTQNGFAIARAASLNGYMSNVRLVKGTAVYTATFTPPTTPLTAISGTSLLTLQNAAFTDNSTNNFVITQYGNTTVTGNSPFNTTGYWSNYFSSTNSYLTGNAPLSTSTSMSTFTIEGWVYPTSFSDRIDVIGDMSPTSASDIKVIAAEVNTSGQVALYWFDGAIKRCTGNTAMVLNQWNYFAIVVTSNAIAIYVNKTTADTLSGTTTLTTRTQGYNCALGKYYTSNSAICYLSNIRVSTVARTISSVPTSPLAVDGNTRILTCQANRFVDTAGTVTFTPTTVSVQSFDPFYTATIASNGGSMYFDGSGDYLTLSGGVTNAGTSDLCLEFWSFYTGSYSAEAAAFDSRTSPYTNGFAVTSSATSGYWTMNFTVQDILTSTPAAKNQWQHVAVTRSGNTFRLFVDGVLRGTLTSSNNLTSTTNVIGSSYNFGSNWPGYISNLRAIKGSIPAAYQTSSTTIGTTIFTPPTAPVTPTAATTLLLNGMNAGAYDAAAQNQLETVRKVWVSTAQSKFGGSSMYFNGSSDWLYLPSSPSLQLAGSFTVEFWINFSNVNSNIPIISGTSGSTQMYIFTKSNSTGLRFGLTNGSEFATGSQTWVGGTWYHVALVRNGTDVRFYVDGINVTDGTPAANSTVFSGEMNIGGNSTLFGVTALNGYIDDLRITKGVARYTANFTPPTQAFPVY